jgi:hypothetical protein
VTNEHPLLAAVEVLPPHGQPNSEGQLLVWPNAHRQELLGWARAVLYEHEQARLCVAAALDARESGNTGGMRAPLEHALWRVHACIERLEVLIARTLDADPLTPHGGSFRVEPPTKPLLRRLSELAEAHPEARRLSAAGARLSGGASKTLRDQLTHSLSVLAGTMLTIEVADLDDRGGIDRWDAFTYLPDGTMPGSD